MVSARTLDMFVGNFTLLSITRTHNGTAILDITCGRHPAGMLSYSRSGYMQALIHATEPQWRPLDLTIPSLPDQTDADWALVGKHTAAYGGPFYFDESLLVDDTHGEIVHGPVMVASLPQFVGRRQHRKFAFSDDGLFLNLVGVLAPGVEDSLWWKKLDMDVTTFDK